MQSESHGKLFREKEMICLQHRFVCSIKGAVGKALLG